MVRGLAALLFQGRAASPSFGPFSAGSACRHPPVVLGNGRLRLPETVFTGLFRWAVAIRWRAGYRGAPHENIYTSKALDYPLLACYPV